MSIIYWLLALGCSPLPDSGLVAQPCVVNGDEVCCEWAYIVDRYCCPTADDPKCDDDCDEAQRAEDRANALWGAERHCIEAVELITPGCNTRAWQYDGSGFEYYDREPTLWSVILWWFMPTPEPFDERLECLRFNPYPEACEGE